MTGPNIALRRLDSQRISQSTLRQAGEVVVWMGALQAQDYQGAKWSIGLRQPKAAEAAIERAINDEEILRTWAMRGTLHFVAAEDIRWMLGLLGPRIIAKNARRYQELELDDRTFGRSRDVIEKSLQGNKELDRPTLIALLEKNGISTAGQRAPFLLQRAALDLLICQGVMRGNNPTYFLLDGAVPPAKPREREEALAELAIRYFTSRGPATVRDFVWWSGLSAADSGKALESAKSRLIQETIDGMVYWLSPSPSRHSKNTALVHLLPGFDEYLLSYKDRSASMDVQRLREMTPPNGMLPPTIVMNGRVRGTWQRTFKKDVVAVECKPYSKLNDEEEGALARAVDRFGAYLGRVAKLML